MICLITSTAGQRGICLSCEPCNKPSLLCLAIFILHFLRWLPSWVTAVPFDLQKFCRSNCDRMQRQSTRLEAAVKHDTDFIVECKFRLDVGNAEPQSSRPAIRMWRTTHLSGLPFVERSSKWPCNKSATTETRPDFCALAPTNSGESHQLTHIRKASVRLPGSPQT